MENKTLCRLAANTVSELWREDVGIPVSDSLLPERRKKTILILRCGAIPLCGRLGRLRRHGGGGAPSCCRILFSVYSIAYKVPYVNTFLYFSFISF